MAAALSLLLVAGLDQLKFYYGAQASDTISLKRAEQLNPYDAGLQVRLALANERSGDQTGNRAALEEAVKLNPGYRQAQASLAKLLIESGKYEEAYARYTQMFAHMSPDANSLVNFGLIASQLDHPDEATSAWQRALDLDARQANAHLYLANAFFKQKQFKDAIPHYEQYLALIGNNATAAEAGGALPLPEFILKVVLQLAAACRDASEGAMAIHFFSQAVMMANKSGDKVGLAFALIRSAEVKAGQGKGAEALADFQRALAMENSGTVAPQAADWFRYGKFLQQAKLSPRLVFACFIRAEILFQTDKNSDADNIANPETTEKELKITQSALDTGTIKSIKKELDSVLQEALLIKL